MNLAAAETSLNNKKNVASIQQSIMKFRAEQEKVFFQNIAPSKMNVKSVDKILESDFILSTFNGGKDTQWPSALIVYYAERMVDLGNFESHGSLWRAVKPKLKSHREDGRFYLQSCEIGAIPLFLTSDLELSESVANACEWKIETVNPKLIDKTAIAPLGHAIHIYHAPKEIKAYGAATSRTHDDEELRYLCSHHEDGCLGLLTISQLSAFSSTLIGTPPGHGGAGEGDSLSGGWTGYWDIFAEDIEVSFPKSTSSFSATMVGKNTAPFSAASNMVEQNAFSDDLAFLDPQD